MKITSLLISATLACAMATSAFAQTAPAAPAAPAAAKPAVAAPATPAKPAAAKPAQAERSAKSIDCSKQADTKNLHGKERKKFRETCMKG